MTSYTPTNTTTGAMLRNNMYAWAASGLGRMDTEDDVTVTFEYDQIARQEKNRITNPLAHIQFATSLDSIRTMFSSHNTQDAGGANVARYSTKAGRAYKDRTSIEKISPDFTMGRYNTTKGTGHANNILFSKMMAKPVVDDFQLVPHLVADASGNNPFRMDLSFNTTDGNADISYVNHMYSNVKIGPGTTRSTTAKGVARTVDMTNTDISCIFHVLDLSNGGDVQGDDDTDICFNIIAAFQIYAKYNHVAGTSTQVWPQGGHKADDDSAYTFDTSSPDSFQLEGFDISLAHREIKKPTFQFTVNEDGAGTNNTGCENCDYILRVLYGDITDMSFTNGIGGIVDRDNANAIKADTSFVCLASLPASMTQFAGGTLHTEVLMTKSQIMSALDGSGLDISYIAQTLGTKIENNSDQYMGDVLLPIVGVADICGGLQCLHVPDSLKNIRRDAAASLAANFAGLSELMGDISVGATVDVSAGEINFLAYNDISGGGEDGRSDTNDARNDTNGVFTIQGSILANKLRNFMLGGTITSTASSGLMNDGNKDSGKDGDAQHIHKVIYSAPGRYSTNNDVSNACIARDLDLSLSNVSLSTDAGTTEATSDSITAANINTASDWVHASYPLTASTGGGGTIGTLLSNQSKAGDISASIAELTPQESAFFYLYPWASAQMCAIGSKIDDENAWNGYTDDGNTETTNFATQGLSGFYDPPTAEAGDHGAAGNSATKTNTCNPFRHYQFDYGKELGSKDYTNDLDMTIIKAAVPTAEGWMDLNHGYYNIAKDRTEWYSFVDICYNNNFNAIQTNDLSYSYQNLPTGTGTNMTGGKSRLTVLDIVFPDVQSLDGGVNVTAAQGNTDLTDNDFCTLNFQVPLKAESGASDRRFAKVANLNAGEIQLANEKHDLKSGFTGKCAATADNLTLVSANITELMNAYMPVVIRLMDSSSIGNPYEQADGTNEPLTK